MHQIYRTSAYRADTDGFESVVDANSAGDEFMPNGLAMDPMDGMLFFAGTNGIYKIDLADDALPITTVYRNISMPYGIAIEWEDRLLFWTSRDDVDESGDDATRADLLSENPGVYKGSMDGEDMDFADEPVAYIYDARFITILYAGRLWNVRQRLLCH